MSDVLQVSRKPGLSRQRRLVDKSWEQAVVDSCQLVGFSQHTHTHTHTHWDRLHSFSPCSVQNCMETFYLTFGHKGHVSRGLTSWGVGWWWAWQAEKREREREVCHGPSPPHPPPVWPLGILGDIQCTHMASGLAVTVPPPLKGSEGHLGKIQCTHIWGRLDVTDALFILFRCGNKGGWTSHCSCPSTASGFHCSHSNLIKEGTKLSVVSMCQRQDVRVSRCLFSCSFLCTALVFSLLHCYRSSPWCGFGYQRSCRRFSKEKSE